MEAKPRKKKNLLFIINPISGTGNKENFEQLAESIINPDRFNIQFSYTQDAGHATVLAEQAKDDSTDCVVAVGGDGTVNEIAKTLLHSDLCMGIVPAGSGNGLARHLGIPLDTKKALHLINKGEEIMIDTGQLNGETFLCTAGVGFDAHVGKVFAESDKRGFMTYVTKSLSEFRKYDPKKYFIEFSNGKTVETEAFVLTFANANQYGNNAYISPFSNIQDGTLELNVIRPFPKWSVLNIGYKLFNKSLPASRYFKTYDFKKIRVRLEEAQPAHVDGEPIRVENELEVHIDPASLRVLVSGLTFEIPVKVGA